MRVAAATGTRALPMRPQTSGKAGSPATRITPGMPPPTISSPFAFSAISCWNDVASCAQTKHVHIMQAANIFIFLIKESFSFSCGRLLYQNYALSAKPTPEKERRGAYFVISIICATGVT